MDQMVQSYAEYLEEKGRISGERQSLRNALRVVLTVRFGPIPSDVEAIIVTADLDRLNDWHRIAITAPDLKAVGIVLPE